jgi:hypothetical protein
LTRWIKKDISATGDAGEKLKLKELVVEVVSADGVPLSGMNVNQIIVTQKWRFDSCLSECEWGFHWSGTGFKRREFVTDASGRAVLPAKNYGAGSPFARNPRAYFEIGDFKSCPRPDGHGNSYFGVFPETSTDFDGRTVGCAYNPENTAETERFLNRGAIVCKSRFTYEQVQEKLRDQKRQMEKYCQ